MPDQLQRLLVLIMLFEVVLCALKFLAMVVNLRWFISHGQEYRRRLDQVRTRFSSSGGIPSETGIAEVYQILDSMGGAARALGVGINEIGLRYDLAARKTHPQRLSWARRMGIKTFLLFFDFPWIAIIGGSSLVFSVQSLDTSPLRTAITIIGAALVILLLLVMTALNIEATVYHACIGRYAHSFINAGEYLRGTEKNRLLREIAVVAGQVVATIFVGTVAIVYLAGIGVPTTAHFTGAEIEGFFDGAYLSAMTFILSTPIDPLSWYAKAYILVISAQGGLLLLLSLAVMIDSGEQRT